MGGEKRRRAIAAEIGPGIGSIARGNVPQGPCNRDGRSPSSPR
ncbi:hypothetical protein [Oxynema sp. CENA135]|nr:hypothetical protein [Oxynema sp. CENA135]